LLNLNSRYTQGCTIPETRSYHVFHPECIGTVKYKLTAEDDEYAGSYKFFDPCPVQSKNFDVGEYVVAKYDHSWWIGTVLEIDTDQEELLIKFMHPQGPCQTFYWPKRDDIIYIAKNDVITKISPPNISRTGRAYQITDEEFALLSHIVL